METPKSVMILGAMVAEVGTGFCVYEATNNIYLGGAAFLAVYGICIMLHRICICIEEQKK